MKNPAEVQGCGWVVGVGLWVWGCGCGVVGVKAKDAGLDSRGQQGSCHLHVCSCTLGRTAFACYSAHKL